MAFRELWMNIRNDEMRNVAVARGGRAARKRANDDDNQPGPCRKRALNDEELRNVAVRRPGVRPARKRANDDDNQPGPCRKRALNDEELRNVAVRRPGVRPARMRANPPIKKLLLDAIKNTPPKKTIVPRKRGVSYNAVKKYIIERNGRDELYFKRYKNVIKKNMEKLLETGAIIRVSGRGLNGSFKVI